MPTWSRLHEVLGAVGRELIYEDIEQVVADAIPEETQLDWKAMATPGEPGKVELAKDVAAMANSGGGVIVYGIGEEGPDKLPVHADISLRQNLEQKVRQVVGYRVRPFIAGIEVTEIENPANLGFGVVVVTIPASPMVPHFSERGEDAPAAPWRNGSHTFNMSERQIEQAFRDRFAAERSTKTDLDRLVESCISKLDFESNSFTLGDVPATRWCVVAVKPSTSPPISSGHADEAMVQEVLNGAAHLESSLLLDASHSVLADRLHKIPSRGFKKWVFRSADWDSSAATTPLTYAECHLDGSVVLACPAGGVNCDDAGGSVTIIWMPLVETTVLASISMAREWQHRLKIMGYSQVQAMVVAKPGDEQPTWPYDDLPMIGATIVPGQLAKPLVRFEPVDGVLDLSAGADGVRQCARDVAVGLSHQFEYGTLSQIASE